jgi:signal transduction histidine kinase/CheY-like chemotaxis protein
MSSLGVSKMKGLHSGLSLTRTGVALIVLSLVLPAALFAIAASQSYYQVQRQQEARVDRTTRILQEHAIKVFETHRLVIGQVKALLKKLDWNDEQSLADFYETLKSLQEGLDQVATITIVDEHGDMLASSRTYPADRTASFADRDWFQALKKSNNDDLYISRSYSGRQSSQRVFNVAARINQQGRFAGAIAVSIDRSYFDNFYVAVEPEYDFSVTLLRSDGEILARIPETDVERVPADASLLRHLKDNSPNVFVEPSTFNGRMRMLAYRPIGTYPVFVVFELDQRSAFAVWRENFTFYGTAAAFAAIALLFVSFIAIRQNQKWKSATLALRAEAASRRSVEEKLRQSQKMEAIGQLTGGIAHDFNNLLTGIIGSLDLLSARIAKGRFTEVDKYINAAKKSSERAAALTHRLLAFSRQQPLDPKPTDCDRLVAEMEDLIRRTIGPSIELEIVGSTGLWTVLVDRNQLENALLNLCINARDAMPKGGKLTIESSNRRLDDHAAKDRELPEGQYISICISDTGTGMDSVMISRAFDPFYTTKPLGQGTGLGLSMTYGFARQSGGQVRIYSELGKGTMVCVYLPRHHGIAENDEAPAQEEVPHASQHETILVIDDEFTIRTLVVEVLTELGYRVLDAADGPAGLKILGSERRIDLLITDVGLPGGMNGRQVVEAARNLRADLKVLFITGYAENAVVAHGHLEPDMHMLAKPFPMDLLATRIKSILTSA